MKNNFINMIILLLSVYNENVLGSALLSELDQKKVYNYKLKDVKKYGENYIASYYGLYEYAGSVGPSTLGNEENIEIVVEDEKTSLYLNIFIL